MDRDYTDAQPFPDQVTMRPIAVVRAPYTERHGTPRQPGFGEGSPSSIELLPELDEALLKDLDAFSHVWVLSYMHLNGPRLNPLVRPPRGGEKRGVLSTRAPHRPNPIALSCVKILAVHERRVTVEGLDLIDGTPVLDLKPYIPDFDAVPEASRGWLEGLPPHRD